MRDGAPLPIALPPSVRAVLSRLADAGLEAALVGGSVRDLVQRRAPQRLGRGDRRAARAGRGAVPRLELGEPLRDRDGPAASRRWRSPPTATRARTSIAAGRTHVRWGSSLADDLARRDFTVNAIAWRPADLQPARARLVDPYGGVGDLRRGVLRAVGDPAERFDEDALRMVRAVRFATRLRACVLDPATEAAIIRPRRPTWQRSPGSGFATSCCACWAQPRRPLRHPPRWP